MVQRTCLNCGQTWVIDRREEHLGVGVTGFHGVAIGTPGAGNVLDEPADVIHMAEAQEKDLDQQLEVVRELRTCPKCGSENYKDRPLPRGARVPD
jgi:ribosomal protein S27AE